MERKLLFTVEGVGLVGGGNFVHLGFPIYWNALGTICMAGERFPPRYLLSSCSCEFNLSPLATLNPKP